MRIRQSNLSKAKKPVYKPLAPAVEQAANVLLCLGRSSTGKMTLTEICDQVGIHKSKGYSILNTLKPYGLIEKHPETKTYSLGPGLLFLARKVLDNLDFINVLRPYLKQLAQRTSSTALFGLWSAEQLFVVAKHEGSQEFGVTIGLGHRFHFTSGAHGKAIVAFLPEEEREKILLREKLYFSGQKRATDKSRLRAELLRCRKRGFASDRGQMQPGINAVSSPVFGPSGKILGCILLIGTFSGSFIEAHGHKVATMAREISRKLGGDGDQFFGKTNAKKV